MSNWWASQNKNYRVAIPAQTLWTRPRVDGVLPRNRAYLNELKPDDTIFHYGNGCIRAVSRVVAPAIAWPRPDQYPYGPNETAQHDDGILVRVELIADNVAVPRERVAQLITWGSPGPLSVHGVPREAYISPLSGEDAAALLAEMNIQLPTHALPGRPHENWDSQDGETDALAMGRIRIEQRHLRAYLLAGRHVAPCAICGRQIPAQLLIAGHIVPRAELTDEERLRFDSAAMLICLMGCDALFEHGYLVVGRNGVVEEGLRATDSTVRSEVRNRLGVQSPAWGSANAGNFRLHQLRHTKGQEEVS